MVVLSFDQVFDLLLELLLLHFKVPEGPVNINLNLVGLFDEVFTLVVLITDLVTKAAATEHNCAVARELLDVFHDLVAFLVENGFAAVYMHLARRQHFTVVFFNDSDDKVEAKHGLELNLHGVKEPHQPDVDILENARFLSPECRVVHHAKRTSSIAPDK